MNQTFKEYHLNQGARIITDDVPGKKSQELLLLQKEIEGSIVSYPVNIPIAIERAKGAILEDLDGNHFIDFFSFAGVLNLGQCNPDIIKAVNEQKEQLIHALDFPTENKMKLIRNILEQFPEGLKNEFKVSFCSPSGSDAVEAAIKLAKHSTGRDGIIAFHGSYHGMTSASMAATSNISFRAKIHNSTNEVTYIPYNYPYRDIFGDEHDACSLKCADYLEYILDNPHSGITKPAAILIEPMQGEGGNILPQKGYLEQIVSIARKHDVLVIFDEIQCGFFRTGKFMASQHTKAVADIYTFSKGLGGIGLPIAAIAYKKSIESWGPGYHVGTFRGNQLSIAAGNAAFEFVKKYNIPSYVTEMGKYIKAELQEIAQESPYIGEVRGEGLMIGVEYVTDKGSKDPNKKFAKKIQQACFKKGLIYENGGHYGNVARFLPPLIITKEIVDNALCIFREANRDLEQEHAFNETGLSLQKDL